MITNYYQLLFWNIEEKKYIPLHPDFDFSSFSSIPGIVPDFGLSVLRKELKNVNFISIPFNSNSYE